MSISAKSKRPSKAINRPFPAPLLKKASAIAERYQLALHAEDNHWFGRGLELPLVMADGITLEQCVQNVREALTAAVAYMLDSGKTPPPPASDELRNVQLNVRLTPTEKSILEQAARRNGFRGLSDYVRHLALSSTR